MRERMRGIGSRWRPSAAWVRGPAITRSAAATSHCRSTIGPRALEPPGKGGPARRRRGVRPGPGPGQAVRPRAGSGLSRSRIRRPVMPGGSEIEKKYCGTAPAPTCKGGAAGAVAPEYVEALLAFDEKRDDEDAGGGSRRAPAGCRGCTRPSWWKGTVHLRRGRVGSGPGPVGTTRPGRGIRPPRRCSGTPPGSAGSDPAVYHCDRPSCGRRSSIWKCGISARLIRKRTAGPWRRWRMPSGWRRTRRRGCECDGNP